MLDQPLLLIGYLRIVLRKHFIKLNPCMSKTWLYCKLISASSLLYPVHIIWYPPPWRRLDLLSTFVLTPILLLQMKTRTSLLRTSSRWSLPHPTLPVVLALCRMLQLVSYSESNLDPILIMLWSIVLAFLLLIIMCIECPLLGSCTMIELSVE